VNNECSKIGSVMDHENSLNNRGNKIRKTVGDHYGNRIKRAFVSRESGEKCGDCAEKTIVLRKAAIDPTCNESRKQRHAAESPAPSKSRPLQRVMEQCEPSHLVCEPNRADQDECVRPPKGKRPNRSESSQWHPAGKGEAKSGAQN